MNREDIQDFLEMVKPATQLPSSVATLRSKIPETQPRPVAQDEDEYASIGLDGLLSATEKLLAVNRGLEPTDERDSLVFKRFMTTDKILAERIKMDADRTRQKMMYVLAKQRNLRGMYPFAFDSYSNGMILGNPLTAPLEEINPLHLMEQSRRATQMGPGGIGSDNAITEGMQAIHGSQFGFLSTLEGPECMDDESEVYTQEGWIPWPEVRDDAIFACRVNGRLEWHKADRIVREYYAGPMLRAQSSTLRMCVTPNHRVLHHWGNGNLQVAAADHVYGKSIKIPIRHAPLLAREDWDTFVLSPIPKGGNAQKTFEAFDIGDWCEYVGWFLAEGDIREGMINITQCPKANPENHARLGQLHRRMGIVGDRFSGTCEKFSSGAKQLLTYFAPYQGKGCYEKWIPEELFQAPVEARMRLLEALLRGDGRWNVKRMCYCTVSERLAKSVERLVISLGYTAFIRQEKDKRAHVKTTNYVVSIHRQLSRQPAPTQWFVDEDYAGTVYCATVPGGFLHVRGSKKHSGFWSGNSEKIGIDTRMAWGTKIGTDGKLYQLFRDWRSGKLRYMSPEDLDGKVVKLPD
jgi:hypothetical protein